MVVERITETQLVKLTPSQLREGMYIARLDRPWLESPFIFQGFPLTTRKELEQLQALCDHVFVDMRKSRPFVRRAAAPSLDKVEKVRWCDTAPLEQEIGETQTRTNQLSEVVAQVMRRSLVSGEASVRQLKPHLRACVESLLRNSSAALWLGHMHERDGALAAHAVRVGLLCMVAGRYLGLPRQDLEAIGLCGLLHDVGKTCLPILGTLDEDRREAELRRHTAYGRDLLLHDPLLPQVVLEAVFSHHERIDRTGYPEGIPADALSYHTRMVSIVDTYDKWCHDEGLSPATALQRLYRERGRQFDQQLVLCFIEAVGIYPPGTVVELNSGEVGVVLDAEVGTRLRPRVALLRDRDKRPIPQFIINLRTVRHDKVQLHILRALEDGAFGVSRHGFLTAQGKEIV